MDAVKLSTLVAGHTGLTGADLRAALRAKRVLSLKKSNTAAGGTWLTDRRIADVLGAPRWIAIKASLAAVAASQDAAAPLVAWVLDLLQDRAAGGLDMAVSASQDQVARLKTAAGLSDDEAWTLRAIGAIIGSDLSVSGVDTAISESDDDLDALIARLPAEVTWQALTDAVTELSKAMQAYPASCAAMLGIEPAAIEPRRTALLGLVTTWRGKIDAGDDTAGMPGDAATALAATAGE